MSIIPDIPPKAFTFSAIVVGYLLIDDTTANEQNALGNWLMLIAQVLCTNAFYKQVQMERGNITENANENRNYTTDNSMTELIRHTIELIKTKPNGNFVLTSDYEMIECVRTIQENTPSYSKNDWRYWVRVNKKY